MMHFGVEGGALFGRVVVEGQEISGATFWRAARDAAGILAGDERGNR